MQCNAMISNPSNEHFEAEPSAAPNRMQTRPLVMMLSSQLAGLL